MIWLTWRQQRFEAAAIALVLALAAAALVPIGVHMASVYTSSGAAACIAHTAASGAGCGGIVNDFQRRFEHASSLIPWLNFLPGLFGILFAAPLVLELEHGTFRLAWTQSVTQRRWLTIKLLALCACGFAATLALSTLMTWWREPLDHLQGRMAPNVFDFEGIVPYAYTFFALALAIALGVFTRRTIVATGGTLLIYFVLRIGLQTWGRQRYFAPITKIWRPGEQGPTNLDRAWNLQSGPVDAHGHALLFPERAISLCLSAPKREAEHCLVAHHIFNIAMYQPASRFWLFQGIETAIFGGLGVALLAAAIVWVRRRVA